jgi:hypothetical protein
MDYQVLFNISVTVAAFFGGWILNRIYAAIDRLDNDVRKIPQDYVSKEDYRSDIKDLKVMLDKIFDKLDGKADK